jgi:diguanylate cyclase
MADGSGDIGSARLFDRIGAFLDKHRLSPEPLHYEFAHRVVSHPESPLAAAVAAMCDGGIRLTQKDIIALGGDVAGAAMPENDTRAVHDGLVAQTQLQVEGFQDLMRAVRAETTGFGRDLAASADAMREANAGRAEDIIRITSAMLDRVRATEVRLEAANREAAELREKLEAARDDARRDPLTGLPNRRVFEESYAEHLQSGGTACVAICDIDKFKIVNDTFGHAIGDRVLKAIADVIAAECKGHVVARYGGEEFAVLFCGISIDDARTCLEAARATVANKRYRLRETDAPLGAVTFSTGLTEATPGEPIDAAFVRADQLLYRAKNAGRNRLMVG